MTTGSRQQVSDDDQPTQQPMRAGNKITRNPSTDQKKVRHQLARQGGTDVLSSEELAYSLGTMDAEVGIDFNILWEDGTPFNDAEQRAYIQGYQAARPDLGPPTILASRDGSISLDAAFEALAGAYRVRPDSPIEGGPHCPNCGSSDLDITDDVRNEMKCGACGEVFHSTESIGYDQARWIWDDKHDHYKNQGRSVSGSKVAADDLDSAETDPEARARRIESLERSVIGYPWDSPNRQEVLAEIARLRALGLVHTAGDPDEPTNLDPERGGWINADDQEYNDGEWTMAGSGDPQGPFDDHPHVTTNASIVNLDPTPLLARTASAFINRTKES
jgi:hypothetical protein